MAKFGAAKVGEDDKKQASDLLAAVYSNLSLCYLKLDDIQKAMECADEAVKLDPKNAKAQLRLGISSTKLRLWDKAKSAFVAVNQLEPNNDAVKQEITVFKAAYGKWADEQKEKEKAAFGGKLS